jgi:hypothetical protein
MDITDIKDELDLLLFLRKSGILERDPYLKSLWQWAWNTQNFDPLIRHLNSHPGLLQQAKRLTLEEESAMEKDPLRPIPEGPEMELIDGEIKIGIVNHKRQYSSLNPMDFTLGLFDCGPPGCGKTTQRLYILDQMLSIPPEERTYRILTIQDAKRDADYLIRKFRHLKVIEFKDLRYSILGVESWDTLKEKRSSHQIMFQNANWFLAHSEVIYDLALEPCFDRFEKTGLTPNFKDILEELPKAIKKENFAGFEYKNSVDHVALTLRKFVKTGQILNCRVGLTIEDFWSKNDIILNIMDVPSKYVRSTIVISLLVDLQRYYTKVPTDKPGLRHLIDIDECRRIFPVKKNSQADHDPHQSMIDWVAGRRSSGMGYMAFTQEIGSAPDWLIDNSSYVVCFPIIGESREKVMRVLNLDARE